MFLVKAFQRLVFRWKAANPGRAVPADVLRGLLERNLLGVDKDAQAVRVACFSLYLAMCDEIDPRRYWTQVRFPPMRGVRLIAADFFSEEHEAFRTAARPGYDLVVGNAPWGRKTTTPTARLWAESVTPAWPVANGDIGTLFLPKAAALLAGDGRVAIIQSAAALLFNVSGNSIKFRRRLFSTMAVEQVVNLSALRFKVFGRGRGKGKGSVAPSCIVVMTAAEPHPSDEVVYITPKKAEHFADQTQIILEAGDRRRLTVADAASRPDVWTALMWGTSRDLALVSRLQGQPTLARPGAGRVIRKREGIIFGDVKKERSLPEGTKLFDAETFPPGSRLYLDAGKLPQAGVIRSHSRDSTDFTAFATPQLLVKQAWRVEEGRFQARLVKGAGAGGTVCTQSYMTVHDRSGNADLLEAACLSLNSKFAAYYLFLTSGRFASYRPEVLVEDIMAVPVPVPRPGLLDGLVDDQELDARAFKALGLKPAEQVLVEDIVDFVIPEAKGTGGPGLQRTARGHIDVPGHGLQGYCAHFSRVLAAGSGGGLSVSATVFEESDQVRLPFRLVAFEFGKAGAGGTVPHPMKSPELLMQLGRLKADGEGTGSVRRMVARVYQTIDGRPTVFILKPDEARYWTRTRGLVDADEVSLDLFRWYQTEAAATTRAAS